METIMDNILNYLNVFYLLTFVFLGYLVKRYFQGLLKKWFKKEIRSFNPNDYPESIPKILSEASCRVFGHICPVFFSAEPLTETKERRKHNRSIPRDVMLKVVRRDGQICQKCHQPVPDDDVEFDHIIPFSKGGKSTVENLRLVHLECNRKKSNSSPSRTDSHFIISSGVNPCLMTLSGLILFLFEQPT